MKQPKVRPLGDKVLIRYAPAISMTEGGLALPTPEKRNEGTIEAVGDGILQNGVRVKPVVKVGDKVMWSGGHIRIDGVDDLILMPEANLVAIINRE